jgi:hypothetical protein
LGLKLHSAAEKRTIAVQVILAKNWWSLVIRGLAAILLGVIKVVRNAISIDELALLFFVNALYNGVVGIAGAARAGEAHSRWTTLMIGVLTGIGAAVVAFGIVLIALGFRLRSCSIRENPQPSRRPAPGRAPHDRSVTERARNRIDLSGAWPYA